MKGLKGAEAWFHEIVSSILNEIAESPKKEGTLITLLGHLYSKGFITGDDVAKGFETLVGILDDMIIDVPAFADMLGRALSPPGARGTAGPRPRLQDPLSQVPEKPHQAGRRAPQGPALCRGRFPDLCPGGRDWGPLSTG